MDTLTLWSSIQPELKKRTLLRGSGIAGVGATLMVISGTFFSVTTLQTWGLVIFGLSVGMITLGLLPYRRLTYLELNPYRLEIYKDQWIEAHLGKKQYRIPIDTIREVKYVSDRGRYGITLILKSDPADAIPLPYFTRRSYDRLCSFIGRGS